MTLEEAIINLLESGKQPATANEIIDGVVASGHSDSREVRSRAKVMVDEGKLVRWLRTGEAGRVYLYALATEEWRAVASKRQKPQQPRGSTREAFKLLEAERDTSRADVKRLREQNDFLVLRNRRLLDLLERAGAALGHEDPIAIEISKHVNANKENA